jgi:glycosyltransferase involved in cell wall biosynthesis
MTDWHNISQLINFIKGFPMDNPKPLVSIFSVVKNRAYTIRRCVESVLSQDYSNIEFIIQDGASTDGTLAILQDYATKYPQAIKLVSQPDASAEEGFFVPSDAALAKLSVPAYQMKNCYPRRLVGLPIICPNIQKWRPSTEIATSQTWKAILPTLSSLDPLVWLLISATKLSRRLLPAFSAVAVWNR